MKATSQDRGLQCYKIFLDGDDSGLEELVRMYSDGLLYYIVSIVGDYSASEDILSDTFLQLIIKPKRFRGDSTLKTYLYSIARNRARDWLRAAARHPVTPIEELADLAADEAELDSRIARDEERRAVRDAIRELPEQYSEVLYLVYFEELSNSEAASVMRVSKKQIENLLYRAKAAMKLRLEARGIRRFEG